MSDPRGGAARPNVIVITCHDLGQFLGCYGVPTVRSPRLDQLAREGVRFDRAFCAAPNCGPSRSALFSGRYPQGACLTQWTPESIPTMETALGDGTQHLAWHLSKAGYATVAVGQIHECNASDPLPNGVIDPNAAIAARYGFDEVISAPRPHREGRAWTDVALDQLDRLASAGRPFFLELGYVETHRQGRARGIPGMSGFLGGYIEPDRELGVTIPPYLIDDAAAREELAELQGSVRYVDGVIGDLLDRVRALGIEDDTIVVMTADHGISMPRAKMSLYDAGLEIALIVRYPRRGWVGGRVVRELVSNVDVFPTLLDAAGVPVPERVQGRSLAPLLDHEPYESRTEVFAQHTLHPCYYDPRRCVRTETHKLIVHFSAGYAYMIEPDWHKRTTARQPWWPPPAPVELYDLRSDPLEERNLAADEGHADLRGDLLRKLNGWMGRVDDPILKGPIATPLHTHALRELAAAGRTVVPS